MKAETKRSLLVEAAAKRFHSVGLPGSSIANVANDAGIPPGNVYYYFRTKDALAVAVHEYWHRRTAAALDDIDASHGDARARLLAFLDRSERNASLYAESGCPIAALSRDFRGGGSSLQALAGRIFEQQAEWLESQFAAIGLATCARSTAAWAVLTSIHGGIGLAHATHSEAPFRAAIADAKARVAVLAAA